MFLSMSEAKRGHTFLFLLPPNLTVLLDLAENWGHEKAALLLPPTYPLSSSFLLFPPIFFSPAPLIQNRSVSIIPDRKPAINQKANFPFLKRPPLFKRNSLDSFSFDFGKVPTGR